MKYVKQSLIATLLALGTVGLVAMPAHAIEPAPGEPFTIRGGYLRMNGNSAQFAERVSDETGTGVMVFNDGPTINSPTITGDPTLPSGFIGSIGEIDANLRSGNGGKLATTTGTLNSGNFVAIDGNGNFVDSGVAPGAGTAIDTVVFASESVLPFADAGTTWYMGPGGKLSDTEADVRVPFSAGTFRNLRCYASGSTGGAGAVITLGTGACTGNLTYPGSNQLEVTLTSTTQVADTTDTLVNNDGECAALRIVWTDTTTDQHVNCTVEHVLS